MNAHAGIPHTLANNAHLHRATVGLKARIRHTQVLDADLAHVGAAHRPTARLFAHAIETRRRRRTAHRRAREDTLTGTTEALAATVDASARINGAAILSAQLATFNGLVREKGADPVIVEKTLLSTSP